MKYSEVLRGRYERLQAEKAAKDRGEDPQVLIKTGLRDFDKRAGLERSILTVIGAATGEGKSLFKKHIQEFAAQSGLTALDLSFEDPPDRSADRTFSTLTGLNNAKLSSTEFTDGDLARVGIALEEAEEWADRIEYHYGLKTTDECLEIIEDSDADLVQVDYAQAFPESASKSLERTIADFAWKLNENAQQRQQAIVIYSQLTSKVEQRGVERAEQSRRFGKSEEVDVEGFRPFGVSDLAWSTALGQRAKGLGFLWRPGRYRRRYGENAKDDRMELIWRKMNFSSEGTVTVGFDGRTARLFDLPEGKGSK